MTWLDGKLAERAAEQSRNVEIRRNAPTLFSAVWRSIVDIATEANTKGFTLIPNGNSEERRILYSDGPRRRPGITIEMPGMERREVFSQDIRISLSEDRDALNVSGIIAVSFPVAPCKQSIVCLHHDGQIKTPEEIAQIIMEMLLFPSQDV